MSGIGVALRVCVVIFAFMTFISWSVAQVEMARAQVDETRRARAATCLLLDQLGADPQTAAERWPCEDLGR